MQEATKREYRQLAEHVYKRLDGPPSPKRLERALKEAASKHRPAYWRRLRRAIEVDQRERGYPENADRVRAIQNPVTQGSGARPPGRRPRRRGVSRKEHQRIVAEIDKKVDMQVAAAVTLASTLGIRPCEMPHLRLNHDDRTIHVPAAKTTDQAERGLSRSVTVPDWAWEAVAASVDVLAGARMKPIQNRLNRLTRSIWPARRKTPRPTLYSFRHQLGSDLKASGLSRREIAAIMGHRSTVSVEQYGNQRSARSRRSLPRCNDAEALEAVREKHTDPPSQGQSVTLDPR